MSPKQTSSSSHAVSGARFIFSKQVSQPSKGYLRQQHRRRQTSTSSDDHFPLIRSSNSVTPHDNATGHATEEGLEHSDSIDSHAEKAPLLPIAAEGASLINLGDQSAVHETRVDDVVQKHATREHSVLSRQARAEASQNDVAIAASAPAHISSVNLIEQPIRVESKRSVNAPNSLSNHVGDKELSFSQLPAQREESKLLAEPNDTDV